MRPTMPLFLTGLFLICMCGLMLQIMETRLLSVMAWYYLAFFAISMAMFGMTAGSLLVYFKANEAAADSVSRTRISSSLLEDVRDAIHDIADEEDDEDMITPATVPLEQHVVGLADLLDMDEGNDEQGMPPFPGGGLQEPPPGGGIAPQPMQNPAEQLAGGQFPAAPQTQPPGG